MVEVATERKMLKEERSNLDTDHELSQVEIPFPEDLWSIYLFTTYSLFIIRKLDFGTLSFGGFILFGTFVVCLFFYFSGQYLTM